MRFIISSTTLLKSLQTISGVVTTSNTLPILNTFYFKPEGDDLVITASDTETTMSIRVTPSMMEEPSEVCIPAKILLETLKTYHETPLTFNVNPNNFQVDIVSENGRFRLAGQDPEMWPQMPQLDSSAKVFIKGHVLVRGITKTIFATGVDEVRPQMAGVLFQFTPEEATIVATDAHKMVRLRHLGTHSEETLSFIMPKKPLNQLKSTVPADDTEVLIEYNESNARYTFDNIVLTCRLIEGRFPNYEAVIPHNNPIAVIVDRQALMASIRRVSIYGNQSTHQMRFVVTGQKLLLQAEDIDFQNAANEELSCLHEGEDIEMGFNSKFLVEILSNLESQNVRFELSSPSRAGLIIPENDEAGEEDLLMLLMPIMVA
ncbi:MAG: DNA polymerase III subunit beta [Bacteroidales bacterium]|jgi:DNA polymerase-3 subunit beta|nr:DNA polymerase III subunit beta [Bacteroidales bacterium]NPV37085.1 DNA polymerase III subunit beta [Bacteroidales bacterium]